MTGRENYMGHPGSVAREEEELRILAFNFLEKILGNNKSIQERVKIIGLVRNLIDSLYRENIVNDEELSPSSEEGSTG